MSPRSWRGSTGCRAVASDGTVKHAWKLHVNPDFDSSKEKHVLRNQPRLVQRVGPRLRYATRNNVTTRYTVAALSGTGGTATWTSPTLATGTWSFRVTTLNANGESDSSATVSVLI